MTDYEQLWWTTFCLTFATIGQVFTVVRITHEMHRREYDQVLEVAQHNGAERDRLGAALEIAVREMKASEWHDVRDCRTEKRSRTCGMCRATRQAKKAWKGVFGDSL